jgi:hypothetical protein
MHAVKPKPLDVIKIWNGNTRNSKDYVDKATEVRCAAKENAERLHTAT